MSELIDKEKLLDTIKPMVGIWDDGKFWINYEIVLDIIESAELERTAKVYQKQAPDRLYYFYCGFCGEMIDCSFYKDYKSIKSYCGYCGAKLDWGE